MSLSDYIPQTCLGVRLRKTPEEKRRLKELARIGANINPLARWATIYTGQNYPDYAVAINAAAQARLTGSVVKEARNLAPKIQYSKLVPMGLLALICLLAYESLMHWAGFRIDTGGRDMPLAAVLHMPSGWLISGRRLAASVLRHLGRKERNQRSGGGGRKKKLPYVV